jgi:UTP--glucose-1-phosphate uridylyltransferase
VWFGREPVDELVVANHRHQPGRRVGQGQGAVVETRAAAEPSPFAIHRKRRHQNHHRGCERVGSKPRTARFAQPEPRFDKDAGPILAPLQWLREARGVMAGDRQQDPHAPPHQGVDQLDRAGLGSDRNIGANGLPAGDECRQMPTQRMRLGVVQVGGQPAASRQDVRSQLGLGRGRHGVNDDRQVAAIAKPTKAGLAGFNQTNAVNVSTMTRPEVPIPRTAVVPAAGLGTRFLPATKTVPKELLPVVDTPGIELVAAEAAEAGAERLIIVTSEGKDSVVAHFVEDLVLEGTLEARGKQSMLEKVRRAPALIKVESVVQAEPRGLGHAVGCVEDSLLPDEDAIAVLLPDDLVLPTGVLETMSKVRAKRGGSVLCAIQVDTDEISAYGVFDVETVPDAANPNVLRVKGMVEKPKAEDAPSPYAAAGRYVLDRAIFDALRRVPRGAGGEIQLTDAIALLIAEGHPVHVVVHRGSRHDLGNPGGYLKAAVDFALERDDYGPELRRWLVERLGLTEH